MRRDGARNTERIRREYGYGETRPGIRKEYGETRPGIGDKARNTGRIRREYGETRPGIGDKARNTKRIRRDEARNRRQGQERRREETRPGKKTGGDKARQEYGEKTI